MGIQRVARWWAVAAGALLAGTLGGAAVARAQQAPAAGAPCGPRQGLLTPDDRAAMRQIFMNRTKEALGLSDQVAGEIQAIFQASRDAARADRQALCQARLDLRALMQQQDSDPAAVKAAGERVKALQAALMDRRLDTYLAVRSKLTPDQWAKWLELRKQRAGRFRGRFGPAAL
jgi:Spy/CpxP family protein refolding chaperone